MSEVVTTDPPSARPTDAQPARIRARRDAATTALCAVLVLFFALQVLGSVLARRLTEIPTPAQSDAIVAYGICLVLVVPTLVLRGRPRAVPLLLATAAGAGAPLLLAKDLLALLGFRDVWVGQSLTLHVLFPLIVGVGASAMALLTPRDVDRGAPVGRG